MTMRSKHIHGSLKKGISQKANRLQLSSIVKATLKHMSSTYRFFSVADPSAGWFCVSKMSKPKFATIKAATSV